MAAELSLSHPFERMGICSRRIAGCNDRFVCYKFSIYQSGSGQPGKEPENRITVFMKTFYEKMHRVIQNDWHYIFLYNEPLQKINKK